MRKECDTAYNDIKRLVCVSELYPALVPLSLKDALELETVQKRPKDSWLLLKELM